MNKQTIIVKTKPSHPTNHDTERKDKEREEEV
jgi:hypothetical protein